MSGRPVRRHLHAAALRARAQAVVVLGGDAERFGAALERYVNAVEVADAARRVWEAGGRELWCRGSQGQLVEHPVVRTMERLDAAAARFGSLLGLDPVSARRVGGVERGRGRPVGAVSAPDRVEPPRVLRVAG